MNLNQTLIIETDRLFIVPMTYSFVSKVLDNDISAYEELGIKSFEKYPNPDLIDIMPMLKKELSKQEKPDGFGSWLFIDKNDNCMVGDGGFMGLPDENGEIEVGYATVENKRRQGYAFEAVTALMKWGYSQPNVKTIRAECLITNTPSYNMLKKLGMTEIKKDDKMFYFKRASKDI